MVKKRLIANLVWRNGMIVQSINFKHTNVIGNAITAVDFFNSWAIDEIILLDVSKSKEYHQDFLRVVRELSKRCFVPLTAGGWVESLNDIRELLLCGADKVSINTQAFLTPELIDKAATTFGNQCIVVSIDVKKNDSGNYEVYIDRGRKATGVLAAEWAMIAEQKKAGEILLTSIDHDGSRSGYDLQLLKSVTSYVQIPVIAFGGVGKWEHLVEGITIGKTDAVAAANIFHYMEHSTKLAKEYLLSAGIDTRKPFFYHLTAPRKPEYKVIGY